MSRQTRSIPGRRRRAIAGAGALAASLAFAAVVAAEPVTGGETTLRPDKDTFEALSDLGIEVVPTNGADFGDKGIVFPITGGEFSPGDNKIKFKHSGGVKLERDDAKVKFKNLVAKSSDHTAIDPQGRGRRRQAGPGRSRHQRPQGQPDDVPKHPRDALRTRLPRC